MTQQKHNNQDNDTRHNNPDNDTTKTTIKTKKQHMIQFQILVNIKVRLKQKILLRERL